MTFTSLPSALAEALGRLPDDQAVSEKHAAVLLGLSVSKLQKDRVKGGGPRFVKHGPTKFARVTYRLGDLRTYLRENTRTSTSAYYEVDGSGLGTELSLIA